MSTIDWTAVEEAEAKGTEESFKVALLEADKLFRGRLNEERIPGHAPAEQIAAAELHFTRPKDIKVAAEYVAQLREGDTPSLGSDRAKHYLQAYRQAMADITEYGHSRSELQTRFKTAIGMLKGRQATVLRVVAGIGIFCLVVVFLADTDLGQKLTQGLVDAVHAVLRLVLIALGIVLVITGAVVVSAVILGRGPKGRIVEEHDEHH